MNVQLATLCKSLYLLRNTSMHSFFGLATVFTVTSVVNVQKCALLEFMQDSNWFQTC